MFRTCRQVTCEILISKAFRRPCGKNNISGYISHIFFIQTVKCSFFNHIIVYRSFYGALLTFSYFLLQGKILFARVSKSLARCLFPKRAEDHVEKIVPVALSGKTKFRTHFERRFLTPSEMSHTSRAKIWRNFAKAKRNFALLLSENSVKFCYTFRNFAQPTGNFACLQSQSSTKFRRHFVENKGRNSTNFTIITSSKYCRNGTSNTIISGYSQYLTNIKVDLIVFITGFK